MSNANSEPASKKKVMRCALSCPDHPTLVQPVLPDSKVHHCIHIDVPNTHAPPAANYRLLPTPGTLSVLPAVATNNYKLLTEWSNGPYTRPIGYVFFCFVQGVFQPTQFELVNGGTGRVRIYGANANQLRTYQERLQPQLRSVSTKSADSKSNSHRTSFFTDELLSKGTRRDVWQPQTVADLLSSWTIVVPWTQLLPSLLSRQLQDKEGDHANRHWVWHSIKPNHEFVAFAIECCPLSDLSVPITTDSFSVTTSQNTKRQVGLCTFQVNGVYK